MKLMTDSNNSVVLDYDGNCLQLRINEGLEPSVIWNGKLSKLKLKRYLNKNYGTERIKYFKNSLTYISFKKIMSIMFDDANKRGYIFLVTDRLMKYIEAKEMYIKERSNIGILIKQHSSDVVQRFELYKEVVNNELYRPLREQQMWDSFFMCTMKKSSNFSVPGSGKTASVYGMYAYLKHIGKIKKIVMIGPKNSFGSWIDEFNACFGSKQELKVLNIQSEKYHNLDDKKYAIMFESGDKNLLLFNYEGVGSYLDELRRIIDGETLLVMDEVHKVKLFNGEMGTRAASVYNASENAGYIVALTGTPIPNSYMDIYNLLHILYRDEYDEFFGFDTKQLRYPTEADIENINFKIKPFYCRTTKSQLGVPLANRDIILETKVTEYENQLFKILLNKYRKNKLTLMIRLLQLESNPQMLLNKLDLNEFKYILDITTDTDNIDFVDYSDDIKELIGKVDQTSKFKACISKSVELFNQKKPVIVWCIFVDSMNRLAKELEKHGIRVGCIYGATPIEERTSILDQFRNGGLDVLITNPHTLAESVSLHKLCHDAIYFEYSYNLVHLLQSKDRIHRLGLPDGQYTQYYYFMEKFTCNLGDYSIGEQIYDRLHYKEQIMLDSIENNILEEVTSPEEDLNMIFSSLGL